MELTDASFLTPVKRKKTLVAYGDSITKGFDALYPSRTCAMRRNISAICPCIQTISDFPITAQIC